MGPQSTASAFLDPGAATGGGDVLSLQCQDRCAALVAVDGSAVGWLVPVLSPDDDQFGGQLEAVVVCYRAAVG
jgi:hypothetical protein